MRVRPRRHAFGQPRCRPVGPDARLERQSAAQHAENAGQRTSGRPRFRDGDYGGGITAAIDALKKHIGGEYTADRYTQSAGGFNVGAFAVFLLFAAFQGLLAVMARSKSWWLGGGIGGIGGVVLALLFGWWLSIPVLVALGFLLDFFVSRRGPSRRGRGGWWIGGGGLGGGGSGGGFGGFSGGSFGGGGASGRW